MQAFETQVSMATELLGVKIPVQQENILAYILAGLSISAAIKAAGAKRITATMLLQDPDFAMYLAHFEKVHLQELEFTRDDAHRLLLEAHRKSVSATEEVMCIGKMIELHGVAAPKVSVNKNSTTHLIEHTSAGDLSLLTDEELFKLQGGNTIDLEPEAITYDD
jgi:hypothetical protein